ncbi:cobalamin biosynthesis protein, partial [Klebsiella pneumoniae]
RAKHEALLALAARLQAKVRAFSAMQLAGVDVPSPSEIVEEAVGTPSVAEAAALLAAGREAQLVVAKAVRARATVAVARR